MAEKAGRGRGKKALAEDQAARDASIAKHHSTTATGDGREVTPADNEKAIADAEAAKLISDVHQIMAQQRAVVAAKAKFDEELAIIKAPFDASKDRLLELFRMGKMHGFQRAWLEAYIEEMKKDGRQRAEDRKREARHRGMLGIGDQLDLFSDKTPLEEQDAAYWRSEGYLAYHRGEEASAPAECPQRFIQAVLQGWNDAQTAVIMAMQRTAEEPPAAPEQVDIEEVVEAELSPAELKAQEKRARASLDNMGDAMLDAIAEVEPDLVAQVRKDYEDA